VTKLEQLALDSLVPPAVIVSGHAFDQHGHGVVDRWTPDAVGYVHFWATRRRCQRRIVPGVTKRCPRSIVGSLRTSAANTARSAQSRRGVGLALRKTATSWRNTRSSTSLDADERPSNNSSSAPRARSGRADATTQLTIMPRRPSPPIIQVRGNSPTSGPPQGRARVQARPPARPVTVVIPRRPPVTSPTPTLPRPRGTHRGDQHLLAAQPLQLHFLDTVCCTPSADRHTLTARNAVPS
jgi:hypothetical protein